MDQLLAMLTELGFGEYEARAYVALLQHNPVNGYELARQSGVPRGSIYGALARLEEKGAVVRVDVPEGTRYAPVAAEEVLQRLAGRYEQTLAQAGRRLAELTEPPQAEAVLNASGYGAMLDHARSLTDGAQRRLTLAVWPQESAALSDQTAAAAGRGVQINTLCLANCPQECGHCQGHIYRDSILAAHDRRWLILAPDGLEVLAAEIGPGASASVVRTRQRLLVDLAESYIRQSTALTAILTDLGPGLAPALTAETSEVLASLDPDNTGGGWLEHLGRLLRNGPRPAPEERMGDDNATDDVA